MRRLCHLFIEKTAIDRFADLLYNKAKNINEQLTDP